MRKIPDFSPIDKYKLEGIDKIDYFKIPELMRLINALKNDCEKIINWIYWQTEKVAEILQKPLSNITDETEITEQWIWTIVPVFASNKEEKTIVTIPDFAISSLWIRIIDMLIQWGNEEKIAKLYQAFKVFMERDLQNNPENSETWKFIPEEKWWTIEDFANIMNVRI